MEIGAGIEVDLAIGTETRTRLLYEYLTGKASVEILANSVVYLPGYPGSERIADVHMLAGYTHTHGVILPAFEVSESS